MFNNHELWRYGFIDCHSCKYCQDKVFCKRRSRTCNFCPHDWNLYINICINNLRLTTESITKQTKLQRTNKENAVSFDGWYGFTADTYYVELVNDTLWLLRHHQTAYVFSLDHIVDVLKFEPDIRVTYDVTSNSFALTLPKKN